MKRVLIMVRGGVAEYIADDGVEVVVYDFDCGDDCPPVPAVFEDLAKIVEVPYEGAKSTTALYDADGEVHVGDVVRFNNKPCYVQTIRRDNLVTIVTMDERKYTLNVLPHQIGCVLGGEE